MVAATASVGSDASSLPTFRFVSFLSSLAFYIYVTLLNPFGSAVSLSRYSRHLMQKPSSPASQGEKNIFSRGIEDQGKIRGAKEICFEMTLL